MCIRDRFWVGAHTVVSIFGLLPNGDISEVAVAMTMLILPLYYICLLYTSRCV